MEGLLPPKITYLAYTSLSELYEYYLREFVARSPIEASCGCRIYCYEHHFVHMVKLNKPESQRLYFPDEKPLISACTIGFGNYSHERRRATRLQASLECLRQPDKVVRSKNLATANRAFIKEFDCSEYPYMVVLVRKDNDLLTLCTGQPVRKSQVKKWLDGELLFPKTPQPPG